MDSEITEKVALISKNYAVAGPEATAKALELVGYFEHLAQENDQEIWQNGLVTTQEWLRLIDAENPSKNELLELIRIVHANMYRSSGWLDLALGVYRWVSSKGIEVAPPEEFFASKNGKSA